MNGQARRLAVMLAIMVLAAGCRAPAAPPIVLDTPTDGWGPAVGSPEGLPAIGAVGIGPKRELRINGEPFFPVMGWLQGPENLPKLKAVGINTIAGYWRPTDGTPGAGGGAHGYAEYARRAGLYFVPVYEPQHAGEMAALLKGGDVVLAWIHDDEPDMPKTVSDAAVNPGDTLAVNSSRPLWKMFDGDANSSAVLDPMVGAGFSIHLPRAATVHSLAVTSYSRRADGPVAKDVTFEFDDGTGAVTGWHATLKNSAGRQIIELERPVSLRTLIVVVRTVDRTGDNGDRKWGALHEVEALDADGNNVLKSVPRKVPRRSPDEVMAKYRTFKRFDRMRPLMMTVSCFYINDPRLDHWWTKEQADAVYPDLFKAADMPGFDVYPIYGWNLPEKLIWVTQGVNELRAYAGARKPTYVWLETQPGGKFGDKAHPVTGREMRNEAWQAIIRGATAIGWFTHRFKPTFAEFGVPEENIEPLRRINEQIVRLGPAILAPEGRTPAHIAIKGGLTAQLMTREYDGRVYVFAQNLDMARRGGTAKIAVDGLKEGTKIEVIDEDRTVTAGAGAFTDEFGPLAVHIYRFTM